MNPFKIATRFITRIVAGSVIAIFLGGWLDSFVHTSPLFLILLLIYVIMGSLYLLYKELERGK